MKHSEPTIFDRSRAGVNPGHYTCGADDFDPAELLGSACGALADDLLPLPELAEGEVVRHYTHLSTRNFSLDANFYPLGSCTMKYNPRVHERAAALAGFAELHPLAPTAASDGSLEIMWQLQEFLKEISGLDAVTLAPAAGAHGELCALKMIAAYFRSRGEDRPKVLIPDSAHGTNPASCTICGHGSISVASGADGRIDLTDLAAKLDTSVAAMMITNPNTLGLFESDIAKIADMVHDAGAMLYLDGANMNAILGITRPGDFGADAMHFNLHKTFSTPHGGGGPGAGPVAVRECLAEFLPVPVVVRDGDGSLRLEYDRPQSIGMVRSFAGQFGVLLRAWSYIRSLGSPGLVNVSQTAVLAANYLAAELKKILPLPHDEPCMHEFVLSAKTAGGGRGLAGKIGKKLLDYGFHAPTVYFPLIVEEALMIEPTETESLATMDAFLDAMREITASLENDPAALDAAPASCPVDKVDEIAAARNPILSR